MPVPSSSAAARCGQAGSRDELFFLDDQLVGVCGDAWSDKPRVESAYPSGRALGEALLERLA